MLLKHQQPPPWYTSSSLRTVCLLLFIDSFRLSVKECYKYKASNTLFHDSVSMGEEGSGSYGTQLLLFIITVRRCLLDRQKLKVFVMKMNDKSSFHLIDWC